LMRLTCNPPLRGCCPSLHAGEAPCPHCPQRPHETAHHVFFDCGASAHLRGSPAYTACPFHPGAACRTPHAHSSAPCPATLAGPGNTRMFSSLSAKLILLRPNPHEPSLRWLLKAKCNSILYFSRDPTNGRASTQAKGGLPEARPSHALDAWAQAPTTRQGGPGGPGGGRGTGGVGPHVYMTRPNQQAGRRGASLPEARLTHIYWCMGACVHCRRRGPGTCFILYANQPPGGQGGGPCCRHAPQAGCLGARAHRHAPQQHIQWGPPLACTTQLLTNNWPYSLTTWFDMNWIT
jgi:hypothetical protein